MTEEGMTRPDFEVCIHCSNPFNHHHNHHNYVEDKCQDTSIDEGSRIFEIPLSSSSSSPQSKVSLTTALSTIFKLNYLTAFTTTTTTITEEQEKNEEEQLLSSLCLGCSDVLINLYQLYIDFLQLGQINSYLSKKLDRFDEIMESHLQHTINCDLIHKTANEKNIHELASLVVDAANQDKSSIFTNNNITSNFSRVISGGGGGSSNINDDESSSSLSIFKREPRLILTRLPVQKYSSQVGHDKVQEEEEDDEENISYDDDFLDCPSLTENLLEPGAETVKTTRLDEGKTNTMGSSSSSSRQLRNNRGKNKKNSCVSNSLKQTRRSKPKKVKERTRTKNNKRTHPHPTSTANNKSKKTEKDDRIIRGTNKSNDKFKHKNYIARRTKFANPCWYCKRSDFSSPASVVEHTKEEHLPKKNKLALVCVRCSKICFDDKYLTSHMQRCELIPSGVILPKSFQCTECSRSFGSKKGLQAHMLHHSTDRPFPCDECPYQGKTSIALTLHKTNKHSIEAGEQQQQQSRVKCDTCGVFVKNENLLKSHRFNMHTPEGYKKYRERQKVLLASLKKKRKLEASQRSTVCPDCSVDLYSRLAYINHRRNFHADTMGKNFVCDQCGRDFTKASSLKLHIGRVHSDERPFLCNKCGKGFKAAHNLRNHDEQTHTTEGRLKYNAKMRERNRRRKLLESQLAKRESQNSTQMFLDGVIIETEPSGQNL